MSLHYLRTSRNNPQLNIFTQTFDAPATASNVSEYTENLQEIRDKSWQDFWQREGFALLEEKWHKRYPEQKNSNTNEENDAWQALWEKHALQFSEDTWHLFSCAFENYQHDLNRFLTHNPNLVRGISQDLSHLEISDASSGRSLPKRSQNSADDADDVDYNDDEQLKFYGLPTAFGSLNKKKIRKEKRQFLWEYSTDSESDNDHNMPQESDEKEPGLGVQPQSHAIRKQSKKKLKNKNMPEFMQLDNCMVKYWYKRFSLFSLFDKGVRLDRESWFSVTPEKIAKNAAKRLACDIIVDAFCGCGGNAIQFAQTCGLVIAIDIDASKLAMAKHNASIYGVAHKIQFVHADFVQFARSSLVRPDVVFLSPPWGGPTYLKRLTYDIEEYLQPMGATELLSYARKLTDSISIFLPRNSDMNQVIRLAGEGQQCEVEHNYLDTRLVAISAYYGKNLIKPIKKETIFDS